MTPQEIAAIVLSWGEAAPCWEWAEAYAERIAGMEEPA